MLVRTSRRAIAPLLLVALLSLAASPAAAAGAYILQGKLHAADAAEGDWYGAAVAVDGDTLLVGSPKDDDRGTNSGSVYVYTRTGSTWAQQAKLVASDGARHHHFGGVLAIEGDTAVVGPYPYRNDAAPGSVYVFTRQDGEWTEQAKLDPIISPTRVDRFSGPIAETGDRAFGRSLALEGDTLVVGGNGGAYVFTRDGGVWTQRAELVASGPEWSNYGYQVGVSGGTVAVLAPYWDQSGSWSGIVTYVYTRSGATWTEESRLAITDGEDERIPQEGLSLALDGDTLMVGSQLGYSGQSLGTVYVYGRQGTNWTLDSRIDAPQRHRGSGFGSTLALEGDTLVVTANSALHAFTRSGSAWTLVDSMVTGVYGAYAMSLSGTTVAVGDYDDATRGYQSGGVHLYRRAASVQGEVRDSAGAAVAGARVVVHASGASWTATTDANGGYVVGGLPGGTYALRVNASAASDLVPVSCAACISVPAHATAWRNVTLVPGATLKGTVNATDGTPIPGVTLTLLLDGQPLETTATTDAQGAYALRGLAAGNYSLAIDPPMGSQGGFAPVYLDCTPAPGPAQCVVVEGTATAWHNVTLGRVALEVTNPLLRNATGASVTTLPMGQALHVTVTVRNHGETPGSYLAVLMANGAPVANASVMVPPGGSEEVLLTFAPPHPGPYALTVGNVPVGSVLVTPPGSILGNNTDPTDPLKGLGTPGFEPLALGAALAAVAAVAGVLRRRR